MPKSEKNGQVPIFYINLARRPDRRAFMEDQFNRLGLTAERVEAVTPDDLPHSDRIKYCNPDRRRWMTETEFACNLSHAMAWRRFLDDGSEHALILEDDATLSRSLPSFLGTVRDAAPDIPVIRIETLGGEARRLGPVEQQIMPHIALRRCFTRDAGAGGYLLTRAAAALLIGRTEMKTELVDAVLFNPFTPLAKILEVRYCDPALSIQKSCTGDKGAGAASDLARSRLEKRREQSRRPIRKWAAKIESWITYDARVAIDRLRQVGRSDIRPLTVHFKSD